MVPSRAMKSMSSGIHVLCIQNVRTSSLFHENNMPWSAGMCVRYISPRSRESGDCASSTAARGWPGAPVNVT